MRIRTTVAAALLAAGLACGQPWRLTMEPAATTTVTEASPRDQAVFAAVLARLLTANATPAPPAGAPPLPQLPVDTTAGGTATADLSRLAGAALPASLPTPVCHAHTIRCQQVLWRGAFRTLVTALAGEPVVLQSLLRGCWRSSGTDAVRLVQTGTDWQLLWVRPAPVDCR